MISEKVTIPLVLHVAWVMAGVSVAATVHVVWFTGTHLADPDSAALVFVPWCTEPALRDDTGYSAIVLALAALACIVPRIVYVIYGRRLIPLHREHSIGCHPYRLTPIATRANYRCSLQRRVSSLLAIEIAAAAGFVMTALSSIDTPSCHGALPALQCPCYSPPRGALAHIISAMLVLIACAPLTRNLMVGLESWAAKQPSAARGRRWGSAE